ncbi:hypothetical protein [Clostridium lundense]|uniref:hypothetical protein n=1 Tax=Clostridium lundense TaxID=319475 RepID=UPI0005521188|nr:hypothetical protein [Clostridium lundense]
MDFVNKNFSNFFRTLIPIAIFFVLCYLFITLVPVIIIAGISIWLVSYLIKKIKLWKSNIKWGKSKADVEIVDEIQGDFPQGEIIDVEFREVK